MTEPSEPGTRIEYAVRYDEYGPAKVPFYTRISVEAERDLVARVAAAESQHDDIRCTVVRREVTYGDWEASW